MMPTHKPRPRFTAHDMRRISVAAAVDPRTLSRFLNGLEVQSTCRARLELAFLQLGLPLPQSDDGGPS